MKNVLREPIVHFWIIGAALFLIFELFDDPAGSEAERIVITNGQVENLLQRFARSRQRLPTGEELQGLVDEYIKEEILYREALLLGLDKDDSVVRGRMRQKMELMSDSIAELTAPTDEQLRDYINSHPDKFATEPRISFRQIYLDPDKRGDAIQEEARRLLSVLSDFQGKVNVAGLGDSLMIPQSYTLSPVNEISDRFGERFGRDLMEIGRGQWTGPLQSGYGLHLVQVSDYIERDLPKLEEIRKIVEWEYFAASRKEMRESIYARLREKYIIVFEEAATEEMTTQPDTMLAVKEKEQ